MPSRMRSCDNLNWNVIKDLVGHMQVKGPSGDFLYCSLQIIIPWLFFFFFYLSFILLKNVYLKKKKGGKKCTVCSLTHKQENWKDWFLPHGHFLISQMRVVCVARMKV